MRSTADIIYHLLLDQNLTVESGDWVSYVGYLPDDPDEAVCVYDTAGFYEGRLMAGTAIEHMGIQIRIRGKDYLATWEKIVAIAEALDVVCPIDVAISPSEFYTIANISRTGTILPVGIEEKADRRRHNFTYNAVVTLGPYNHPYRVTVAGDTRVTVDGDQRIVI